MTGVQTCALPICALAAVAALLPAATKAPAPVAAALPEPAATDGYQLTDHVKQYYATARI